MKRIIISSVIFVFVFCISNYAQELPSIKLKRDVSSYMTPDPSVNHLKLLDNNSQLPKRKTVGIYFGAGYSFVIFTAHDMNNIYPVFQQSTGDFLSEVNLFIGFSIAKALTLEFEPSILFTHSNQYTQVTLSQPANFGGYTYSYVYPQNLSMLAFPLAVNARFFPFFKSQNFVRLFFIGAGAGVIWIREQYDDIYSNDPTGYYYQDGFLITESTSQWAPLARVMTGFTGTGGMFGFGGELRFNFIPLKRGVSLPFATRIAPNFNSVDLSLRFYFSM